MNQIDLNNKTAVITGGAQGFGYSMVERFSQSGAKVVIWDKDQELIDSLDLPENVSAVQTDVTSYDSVEKSVQETIDKNSTIDILVNNAGITRDNILLRMKDDEWEDIINTNLSSIYKMSKSVLRGMIKNRSGRIISITSVVGAMGNAGQSNYGAAKAGIIGFTKSLAREVGVRGITVNAIAPGFIETDMTNKLPEDQKVALASQIPMARLGTVDEIAQSVLFLASEGGSYITAQTLHVNGGMYTV